MKRMMSGIIVLLLMVLSGLATVESDLEHLARINEPDEVDRAVERGLQYLLSRQDATEGYFEGKLKHTYTGLATMALMAAGHFPGRSEFGEGLRRGIAYLVRQAEANDGYFGGEGNARMYGHAICTLALVEAYGMMPTAEENAAIRDAARKAVNVILNAQVDDERRKDHFGGWRYEPTGKDADLSVTAWQIMVLRAAENCQLDVPHEAISNAVDYVRNVYHRRDGGFGYQPGRSPNAAMRSAGVVSMRVLGAGEDSPDWEQIRQSAEFLSDFDPSQGSKHWFYQSYYVATAANMMGDEYRDALLPRLERHLVSLQQEDGSFRNYKGHDGGTYSTAFSLICLAVRYQYLPIYQE